jgi:hypothetical protein
LLQETPGQTGAELLKKYNFGECPDLLFSMEEEEEEEGGRGGDSVTIKLPAEHL